MVDEKKGTGTYVEGIKHDDGTITTTEHGFTFTQENGQELAFDLHEMDGIGTALLFGNQIFFLKFWEDEHLDKALEVFTAAVQKEKDLRNDSGTKAD
jgi:hypothetical protein